MQPNTRQKITCEICGRDYVHSGHYLRHAKSQHPELSEMLETSTPREDAMDMDNQDMDKDIDDLPPVSTPILVAQTEHHEDGPQAVDDDVDMAVGHRQPSCPNPYTPFMD